jgi:plastocyanin
MLRGIHVPSGVVLAVAAVALVVSSVAIGAAIVGRPAAGGNGMMGGANGAGMMGSAGMMGGANGAGMMGGNGMMGGTSGMMGSANGAGMMGGNGMMGGPGARATAQPGTAGFVPGTTASPRVVRVFAGPGYIFSPATITVARGETVTFAVTAMGPLVHEFMVGPADAVAADQEGTPEIADIGMMQAKSLTYTFDGSGPYAYACHADGHYEAGMHGMISVVG